MYGQFFGKNRLINVWSVFGKNKLINVLSVFGKNRLINVLSVFGWFLITCLTTDIGSATGIH
jgi:hypothetical protein